MIKSLMRKLLNRFRIKTQNSIPVPINDAELEIAIRLFREGIHNLRRMAGTSWGFIPAVHCPIPFGGWGSVEGRNKGFKINTRLWVVEGDEDIDFTEVCVIVDNIPCLILEMRYSLTVTIIAGQNYFEELLQPSGLFCANVEDFRKLAVPIQKILFDVFSKVLEEKKKRPGGLTPGSIEAILQY